MKGKTSNIELQAAAMADQVLSALRYHRGECVFSEDIAREVGTSDRIARAAVAVLRERGELIVADPNGGYRFARDYEDVLQFTASLKSRMESLRQIVVRMELAARSKYGDNVQPRLL